MSGKMTKFKDLLVDTPNRYTINGEVKTIVFAPNTITQEGTKDKAEYFNEMQKNGLYNVNATRLVEGTVEFYDVSIDGSDIFDVFDTQFIINFNETNTKLNPVLRFNGNNYYIRMIESFIDADVKIGTLQKTYFGFLDSANNKLKLMNYERKLTFNTVADLQTATWLVEGDTIQLLGYHTKNDGGGHFGIIQDFDDGREMSVGSLFCNLLSNKIEGYVNPRWVGALPNGTDSIFYLEKCRLYSEPIYSTDEFSVASEFFTDEAKIKLLRLTPIVPTNVFNCARNSKIEGLEIDCKNIQMGSFYAFRIKPSNQPLPIDYNYDIRNVKLKGNSSNLQGTGLYLETLKTVGNDYSLIQFIRAHNFQITGFRDGVSMFNNMSEGGICYINGNIFTNFDILQCYRPVRLICNGTPTEIGNGFSISGNFFDKFMLQHTAGLEDAWHLEGATNNYIDSFNFDWSSGLEFYFDTNSYDNEILNDSTTFNKVNDISGRNKLSKELKCQAKVVFDGTTSPPTIKTAFNVSSVTKNSIGNYTVNLIKPLRTENEAASIDGNTMTIGYNTLCHTHNGYTASAIPIVSHKTDGTFVDLTRISMIII